jgi:HK97 family phage portal protein
MPNLLERVASWLVTRAAGRLPVPRGSGAVGLVYTGGQFELVDYLTVGGKPLPIQPKDAGDPLLNPIVCICLGWIGTSWPQALPQVGRMRGAEFAPDPQEHPLVSLLHRPNPDYSGKWLMWALNADYWTRGNAYAQIIGAKGAGVQELNYLPAWCVTPVPDKAGYLSHYAYAANGETFEKKPEEILHIRYGIHPDDPLQGVSPLRSAFRELVVDNGAADYKGGLMRNGGMPPGILTPDVGKDQMGRPLLTNEEAKVISDQLNERLAREPGRVRLLTAALRLIQLSWKPGEMGLEILQQMPETRIPALFQIPPVVLQLYAGLQKSTYNNMETAIAQAWRGCLVPTQDYFAEEMTNKLLRVYYRDGAGKVVKYDRSQVRELQPDQNEAREQARKDYEAGIITLEEARAAAGRETPDAVRAQLKAEREERRPAAPPPDPQDGGAQRHRPFAYP